MPVIWIALIVIAAIALVVVVMYNGLVQRRNIVEATLAWLRARNGG